MSKNPETNPKEPEKNSKQSEETPQEKPEEETTEPAEPTKAAEPEEPTVTSEPAEAKEAAEAAEPTESPEPAEGEEPIQPSETAQTEETAKPAEPMKTIEPTAVTGTDDGEERIIPLSELKEEAEYDPEEAEFMSRLYEDTMQQIKPGEIITGKIVSISDRDVAIDIGFKSEGTVPIEEFEDPSALNIGDSLEVYLENIEDQDGQLVLSKRKADFARVWAEIMDIYERGETIKGRCIRRIKGGIVVDVKGIDAFLPGSQIDIHPVRDFDSWIGQECDFRIVKVNEARKNIVLSRRGVREQILNEIQIGQEIEGVVKNITDFGAFVDLGGVDGLLHITDISWGRINHPSEVVSYDEKLKVKVLDFDPVRKRISVGLKQLTAHPWDGIEERFPVNSRVTGKVVSITKYGAFVELHEGIEGLIHISEMSWTQHIKHPSQILNIGQEVEVVVLNIDAENRKISLGLKQTEEDPWEKLEQKYTMGSVHKGVVRDLVPFGAFVELEDGVEGLVHISDLSWTRKVRHPGEVVKKGDEIDVQILSFDRNERRIALGHKQTKENPWELFEKEYPVGSLVEGTVVRTVDKGAIVELNWGLESFLPVSHFGKDPETGRGKALKEGETLQVEIIDFDKENKKIVVSAANVQKRTEEAEYQEYLKAQESATQSAEETAVETPADAVVETPVEEAEEVAKAEEKAAPAEEAIPAEEAADTAEPEEKPVGEEAEKPQEPEATKSAPTEAGVETPAEEAVEVEEEVKEEKPKPKKKAAPKKKTTEAKPKADKKDESPEEVERTEEKPTKPKAKKKTTKTKQNDKEKDETQE
jgi:small subunit ribosomal protein S1